MAVVTGGSEGIGRAVVERIISSGGRVATVARRGAPLRELESAVPGVVTMEGDVTEDGVAERLMDVALEAFGRIDALINNVGRGDLSSWDTSIEEWVKMFEVNTLSAVRMCKAAVGPLKESDSPRIVNIASEVVYKPDHELVPYTAAKAALLSFSKSLAWALAADDILVNVVVPGTVATPSVVEYYDNRAKAAGRTLQVELENFIRHRRIIPLNRLADPAEIAEVIAFVASDRLTFCTGSVFRCDGGSSPTML